VHIRDGRVVHDAERSGLERTAPVKDLQAAPELEVNLLPEVVALLRVGLVPRGEPVERAAEVAEDGRVQFVAW